MSPNPSLTVVKGLTFEQWFHLVDAKIQDMIGLSVYDLADSPSWDYWSSGYSVAEAAKEIILNDDTYAELLEFNEFEQLD